MASRNTAPALKFQKTARKVAMGVRASLKTAYADAHIMNFGGGLNTIASNNDIADNQLADAMNVNFDAQGAVVKRQGFQKIPGGAVASSAVMSLIPFTPSAGTASVVASYGTSLVALDPVTGGTMPKTLKTGLTGSGLRFTGAMLSNKLYLGNGVDANLRWDGTTMQAQATSPAPCKYLVTHAGRMYMAGDAQNPNRLYFSNIDNADDWTDPTYAGFIDIDTNDGDIIMGLATLMDTLVIFKRDDIYQLRGTGPSGTSAYDLVPMHVGVGTVSHFSVQNVENNLVFLHDTGVWSFNGVHVQIISEQIAPSIVGGRGLPGVGMHAATGSAVSANFDHKYWLSVPLSGGAQNIRTFVWDWLLNAWTQYDFGRASLAVIAAAATQPSVLWGGSSAGVVYQEQTGDADDGAAIDAYFVTKAFDFGYPEHYKRWKRLFAYAEASASTPVTTELATYESWASYTDTNVAVVSGDAAIAQGSATWQPTLIGMGLLFCAQGG